MLGIQFGDVISAGLIMTLIPLALAGYRINQRCKDRRTWWSQVDGFLKQEESFAFSTPASNLGLGLLTAAVIGLLAVALSTALRHHVAESFIVFSLWLPIMLGLVGIVCLPFLLIARWGAKAVSGLKQAR